MLRLKIAERPSTYRQLCARLKVSVARMLSTTRSEKFACPDESVHDARVLISSDYSGLGTAEHVASEIEDR